MDNLKSWNVEKGPGFVNCCNFVTIFCRVLKMKYFFNIPSYPRPFAVQNSLTNQFYQKNWGFSIVSTKSASLNRDIHPGDSWPYFLLKVVYGARVWLQGHKWADRCQPHPACTSRRSINHPKLRGNNSYAWRSQLLRHRGQHGSTSLTVTVSPAN